MGVHSQRGAFVAGLFGGLLAVALSLGRVLFQADSSVGELVWAEDGLFPLCVRKAGMWDCLSDPFAGYLLGLPRLLAGMTAAFPMDDWGWTTNVVAALGWGVFAGLAGYWLVVSGIRLFPAIVIALIPVAVPLVGFEAVNSIGSIYMPLLFTATLALAVGWNHRAQTVLAAGLAFLATVTIPIAALLIGPLAHSVLRQRISHRSGTVVLGALVLGSALQFAVIVSAPNRRNMVFSSESIGFWLSDLPTAALTLWPGLYFGSVTVFGIFTMSIVWWTGALLALGLLVLGITLAVKPSTEVSVAGVLLVSGLAYSFIPTATGYASNRYFVMTVTGLAAAAVLLLDNAAQGGRSHSGHGWRLYGVVAVFALAWTVALPASTWRATPAPAWSVVLEQVRTGCAADPTAPARFTFSPDWPQDGVTDVQPPTNQLAPCSAVDRSAER